LQGYSTISPQLKQPFFIGDGKAGTVQQTVIAPAGATRLFLGSMDGSGWFNNTGSFSVDATPEPGSASLLLISAGLLSLRRRRVTA
jgi:hypothetical protein